MEIKTFPVPKPRPDRDEGGVTGGPEDDSPSHIDGQISNDARSVIRSASTAFLNQQTVLQIGTFSFILASLIVASLTYSYSALVTVPLFGFAAGHCVSCAVSIMLAISNGERRLEFWPSMSPYTWLSNTFWLTWAVIVAGGVPFFISIILLGQGWVCGVLTILGTLLLLPVVAVSMLRSASLGSPLEKGVVRTLQTDRPLWLAFHGIASALATLVVIGPILFVALDLPAALTVAATVVAGVCGLFAYCSILGALAHRIDLIAPDQ